eukprot:TRINITY_DN14361_c0_g1_i3.p1 TRINITY_DN14361_c0_g1~~TRINITY_DN14361_c0_g1_i3.p1  ORF type:complete len:478 (-),score=81.81 TRINITY_DN14361_c0_g1_i3:299-1732(-)
MAALDVVALTARVEELYTVRDREVFASRQAREERLQDLLRDVLTSIPDPDAATDDGGRASAVLEDQRALVYFLRGRARDVLAAYQPEAERDLAKAVRLDPALQPAWCGLGHCKWKQEKMRDALECYRTAASLNPKDKIAARELARVLRFAPRTAAPSAPAVDPGTERKRLRNTKAVVSTEQVPTQPPVEAPEEDPAAQAVVMAKRAVSLDVSDGASWYVLGNAWLGHYIGRSLDPRDLETAVRAYENAERRGEDKNPDLHYNKGTVLRYLCNYADAFTEFATALRLDPALAEAEAELSSIRSVVEGYVSKVAAKCNFPQRAFERQLQALPAPGSVITFSHRRYSALTINNVEAQLPTDGGTMPLVFLKVMATVSGLTDTPQVFVAFDCARNPVALTLFNLAPMAIKECDEVAVARSAIDPRQDIIAQRFTLPVAADNHPTFDFVQLKVANPGAILVNRRPIPTDRFLAPQMTVHQFT